MKFATLQILNEIASAIEVTRLNNPEFAKDTLRMVKEALSDRAETDEKLKAHLPLIEIILAPGAPGAKIIDY